MRRRGRRGFVRVKCGSGILVGARRWMEDRLLGVGWAVVRSVRKVARRRAGGIRELARTGNFSLGLVFSFPSSSGSYSQGRACPPILPKSFFPPPPPQPPPLDIVVFVLLWRL